MFNRLITAYPGQLYHSKKSALIEKAVTLLDKVCKIVFSPVVVLIRKLLLRDKRYYYGCYYSSHYKLLTFLNNLASPKRVIKKFLYGQIVRLPANICMANSFNKKDILPEAKNIAEQLKSDGAVMLPILYSEFADYLVQEYLPANHHIDINMLQAEKDKKISISINPINQKIMEFMADPLILSVFALYLGYQPYIMAPSDLVIVYPDNQMPSTRMTTPDAEGLGEMGWHYDTVNLIQSAILLKDITKQDSHMEVAKGGNNQHHVNISRKDYFYSDEYIKDHYEIFHCCGPMGSVYLFDPNAPHRLNFSKNSMRVKFKTMYSPGNDSRAWRHPNANNWINLQGLDLSNLNSLQRSAFTLVERKK